MSTVLETVWKVVLMFQCNRIQGFRSETVHIPLQDRTVKKQHETNRALFNSKIHSFGTDRAALLRAKHECTLAPHNSLIPDHWVSYPPMTFDIKHDSACCPAMAPFQAYLYTPPVFLQSHQLSRLSNAAFSPQVVILILHVTAQPPNNHPIMHQGPICPLDRHLATPSLGVLLRLHLLRHRHPHP